MEKKEKKYMTVLKEEDVQYSIPDKPKEFLEFFSDIFKKIPEKYLEETTIDFSGDEVYGSYVVNLEVYYLRPETDEEFAERKALNEDRKEKIRIFELEQLKKLKTKYEE